MLPCEKRNYTQHFRLLSCAIVGRKKNETYNPCLLFRSSILPRAIFLSPHKPVSIVLVVPLSCSLKSGNFRDLKTLPRWIHFRVTLVSSLKIHWVTGTGGVTMKLNSYKI